MLISVVYKKIKMIQASWSAKPMLFLWIMKRTVQFTLCYDENCQCVHMQSVKPAMKSSNVQSVEPAILQSHYKKNNPQSSYKKKNQVK